MSANNDTTLSLIFPAKTRLSGYFASIIGSDASATTFSIDCGSSESCELPTPYTLVQGPSTMSWAGVVVNSTQNRGISTAIPLTGDINCTIVESRVANCRFRHNTDNVTTTEFDTISSARYVPVVITAAAAAAAATSAAPVQASITPTAVGSGPPLVAVAQATENANYTSSSAAGGASVFATELTGLGGALLVVAFAMGFL